MEETESFEAFTETSQTIICDCIASISKLANLSEKVSVRTKVQLDALQQSESAETFTEIFQTLICNIPAAIIRKLNPVVSRIAYDTNSKRMDCKALSLLRFSPRLYKPLSVISHL